MRNKRGKNLKKRQGNGEKKLKTTTIGIRSRIWEKGRNSIKSGSKKIHQISRRISNRQMISSLHSKTKVMETKKES